MKRMDSSTCCTWWLPAPVTGRPGSVSLPQVLPLFSLMSFVLLFFFTLRHLHLNELAILDSNENKLLECLKRLGGKTSSSKSFAIESMVETMLSL